jgi:hypothetical protein
MPCSSSAKAARIKLSIPYSPGQGGRANHNVPPYSTLIFEIEVPDIIDTPPPNDAAPASKATPVAKKK